MRGRALCQWPPTGAGAASAKIQLGPQPGCLNFNLSLSRPGGGPLAPGDPSGLLAPIHGRTSIARSNASGHPRGPGACSWQNLRMWQANRGVRRGMCSSHLRASESCGGGCPADLSGSHGPYDAATGRNLGTWAAHAQGIAYQVTPSLYTLRLGRAPMPTSSLSSTVAPGQASLGACSL